MPCYSTVTRTKMTDEARLAEALKAEGYVVTQTVNDVTATKAGSSLSYFRNRQGEAFSTYALDGNQLNAVARKYTEIGVRAWAQRKGFSVGRVEDGGRKLTLINRRG